MRPTLSNREVAAPPASSSFDELILRQAHPSTSSSFDKLILRQAQDEDFIIPHGELVEP
jgi:hypothetical protein